MSDEAIKPPDAVPFDPDEVGLDYIINPTVMIADLREHDWHDAADMMMDITTQAHKLFSLVKAVKRSRTQLRERLARDRAEWESREAALLRELGRG